MISNALIWLVFFRTGWMCFSSCFHKLGTVAGGCKNIKVLSPTVSINPVWIFHTCIHPPTYKCTHLFFSLRLPKHAIFCYKISELKKIRCHIPLSCSVFKHTCTLTYKVEGIYKARLYEGTAAYKGTLWKLRIFPISRLHNYVYVSTHNGNRTRNMTWHCFVQRKQDFRCESCLSVFARSAGPQSLSVAMSLTMEEFSVISFTMFMWWWVLEVCLLIPSSFPMLAMLWYTWFSAMFLGSQYQLASYDILWMLLVLTGNVHIISMWRSLVHQITLCLYLLKYWVCSLKSILQRSRM